MTDVSYRRNETRAWVEIPVEDNGEAIVAAMAEAGIEYVFFTSGSEIGFIKRRLRRQRLLAARPQSSLWSLTSTRASTLRSATRRSLAGQA